MRLLLVALLLLVATPATPLGDALRPHPGTSSWYGESFTFLADLEDGTYVHVSFAITNLGPGSAKGICRVTVVAPDGAIWKASERVSRQGWSHEPGLDDRLTVGPCVARSGPTASIELILEGGRIRLAYADRLRRRGPVSAVDVDGQRFAHEMLLLGGRVDSEVALPDSAVRKVAGWGYADHSRGTVAPKALARRWVRFRGMRSAPGLVVLGREGHDGTFGPVWACDASANCRDLASFSVRREGGERGAPFSVKLGGSGEGIVLRSGKVLYRDAPVEELGLLGRIVAPVVGSPVTWVFRGSATADGSNPSEGILEVELASDD